jgi:hypothetical protein
MQTLTAFLTAFDPLAALFIAGIVAFVVMGGIAVMRDDDMAKLDPQVDEKDNMADPPAAETIRPAPTDGPEHGGTGRRRRRRAA